MKKVSNEPLVSVIIPVYNVEPYLKRCLDSVIKQTYKNLQIIVVDDGSTDNSGKICDEYAKKDKRIEVVHKKNGGLSDARNVGIKKAKGDYLTFIDSDDWVEKELIEMLLGNQIKNKCDISAVKHYVDYPYATINTGSGKKGVYLPYECLDKMLYSEDFDVSSWAKLYSANIFHGILFPKGQYFEDSATTYKLILKAKKIFLDSIPLYYYVIRKNSVTNSSFSERDMDIIKSTKMMTDCVSKIYPNLKNGCARRLMYAHLSAFRKYSLSKNKNDFRKESSLIFEYIKRNRKTVLKDKRIPRRDRFALRFAFNRRALIAANIAYDKIRNRL